MTISHISNVSTIENIWTIIREPTQEPDQDHH